MLKKTITYTDYNGIERKEDFYFNLSKAELTEMEHGVAGGMTQMLNTIIEKKDTKEIMAMFKAIILKGYGEKSPDGKRFMKSNELSIAFSQTEAYTELFMEIATNADAATNFVNAMLPPLDKSEDKAPQP